jgi:release factor glutamine methyltransferase
MTTSATQLLGGASVASVLRLIPLEAVEARLLVMHALDLSRVALITQPERVLNASEAGRLSELVRRRLQGEPIAYLLGRREFYGLELTVTPEVLIPRPETELLVELSLGKLSPGSRLLDLGTGCGAIAIAVAHARPDVEVVALDRSFAALQVAQTNAMRHAVNIRFLQSDWFAALPQQTFDVIVSNPPYIAAGDPHLGQGDLRFEPVDALTDHADGLSALRSIARDARGYLNPDGMLLLEHGYDQAAAVRDLLAQDFSYAQVRSWRDLADIERVSGGLLK